MRVPERWLRSYCDPGLSVAELGELLALRTTEVERITRVGPPSADGFVVGRVLSVEPHPDADRLSVCEVETGDATRTIVCGAPLARTSRSERRFQSSSWPVLPPPRRLTPIEVISVTRGVRPSRACRTAATPP